MTPMVLFSPSRAEVLPINTYGDEVLRQVAAPIEGKSDPISALANAMLATMYGADGVGLAAPQVGNAVRLFVLDISQTERGKADPLGGRPYAMLNPEIVDHDGAVEMEEGCLSIPDVRDAVTRPDFVRVRYRDLDFVERTIEATGLLSRVIQHELDHLDGVLFIDHLSALRRRFLRRDLREIMAGRHEAEYPTVEKRTVPKARRM